MYLRELLVSDCLPIRAQGLWLRGAAYNGAWVLDLRARKTRPWRTASRRLAKEIAKDLEKSMHDLDRQVDYNWLHSQSGVELGYALHPLKGGNTSLRTLSLAGNALGTMGVCSIAESQQFGGLSQIASSFVAFSSMFRDKCFIFAFRRLSSAAQSARQFLRVCEFAAPYPSPTCFLRTQKKRDSSLHIIDAGQLERQLLARCMGRAVPCFRVATHWKPKDKNAFQLSDATCERSGSARRQALSY